MAKYLLFAFSDCKDPKREKEFNDWYDNIHIPDMLEVPGMISATRWMSAEGKQGEIRKYLALYELETDDIKDFNSKVRARGVTYPPAELGGFSLPYPFSNIFSWLSLSSYF